MVPLLFRCPNTATLVQHDDAAAERDGEAVRYEAVECLACGLIHLVNPAIGKLLSEEASDHPAP